MHSLCRWAWLCYAGDMTAPTDIERLAAQIAEHLSGEATISLDAHGVHDLGDVLVSFAQAQLKEATNVDRLTEHETRRRLEAVCALCRDLVADSEQPVPVRALAARVLGLIKGGE